jgi:hypothetical protein
MGLRASDEERERVVGFLRAQQALGRLTLDELEERSAAAWAAVEVADLDRLMADLPRTPVPGPPPAVAVRPRPRAPWFPGWRNFSVRWRVRARPNAVMADLLEDVAPPMLAYGFKIEERTPDRVVFTYPRTPGWVILPCVFLFPFGLLALLIRTHDRVTVELADRGGETVLIAHGLAPLSVRKAFAELET